ncbi:Protein N-acetyltransferase, RimJ/RimL family [Pedobacter steynii]|uniref:Protein N-acetyltransferase, RimJ/RimL family n=2 Tax=Pedobacter steynii TaxID=430522 RepID=A0A1G9R0H2_9SPHI|nr:GNAT family N-acetyltransferase [Pedobacter steynii]SDM16766.1 Protein N-acetyltransferase, RimJ/RimL family [Pedobacter steynii]
MISTDRLFIAEMTLDDAEFILKLLNTEGWKKFIGERNVNNKQEAEVYIRKIIDNPNFSYSAVRLKGGNVPIGMVSMIKRDYLDHHDIGFAFLPDYNGKGYAFEAASAVLNHPSTLAVHTKILATTLKHNSSSIQLLERLGLVLDKEIKVEGKELFLYNVGVDELLLNQLTHRFFGIFNNTNEDQPDWGMINETCLPEAIFIKKTGLEEEVYHLQSFIAPRRKILSDGTLKEFKEWETLAETKISGNIAQRFSKYEKSGALNGTSFKASGNKIFQFIKTWEGWRISAVVWEDVTAG